MSKPKVQMRKPPTVPAVADSFVAAAERQSTQTSERPTIQTSAGGRALVSRRDGTTLRRMTVYLPPDLAKRLQLAAIEHERDMSDIVSDAVSAWVANA